MTSQPQPPTSSPSRPRSGRPARTVGGLSAAVAALALGLSLTACGSPAPVADNTTGSPATTTPAETTPAESETPMQTPDTTSAAPTTSAPAGPTACAAADLTGKLDDSGGGAAGSVYMKLIVTNSSTATCTIDGYPDVFMVGDNNGTQLGPVSKRNTAAPSKGAITLAPGKTATAVLQYTQAGNYPDCKQVPANGFRVFPPSATDALYIAHPLTACSNTDIALLTVGAFQP
jgi:hypothetical protein